MIAFQHIKSGRFFVEFGGNPAYEASPVDTHLLCDAYAYAVGDEARLREKHAFLADYRTVTYSTRIDHPDNDLARLSREQLAERYPIAR